MIHATLESTSFVAFKFGFGVKWVKTPVLGLALDRTDEALESKDSRKVR